MKYDDYMREREIRSPAFRAAYEEALEELAFARQLINARAAAGLEGGTYQPSIATLQRLAEALNIQFEVTAESGLRIREPAGVPA
jgi:transcriptional regulator with XRE-family HTH domain